MSREICRYAMVILGEVHAMCNLPQGHQVTKGPSPTEMYRWGGHRLMLTTGMYLNAPFACGHCGRPMGDMAGGYAIVKEGVRVCHPNVADRPDCYRLITVYQEVLGVRLHETEMRYV